MSESFREHVELVSNMVRAAEYVSYRVRCPVCDCPVCADTTQTHLSLVKVVCPKCGAFGSAISGFLNDGRWDQLARALTRDLLDYKIRVAEALDK